MCLVIELIDDCYKVLCAPFSYTLDQHHYSTAFVPVPVIAPAGIFDHGCEKSTSSACSHDFVR